MSACRFYHPSKFENKRQNKRGGVALSTSGSFATDGFTHSFICVPSLPRFHISINRGWLTSWDEKVSSRACERQTRQVGVFDSDWCISVSCCFTAPPELYKSSYSPVSSPKDSGGTRPGGVCAQCSCCQHDCSHSGGHSGAADLQG